MTILLSLPDVRPALVALFVTLCGGAPSGAAAQTRGALLYTTHCLACHSTQVHWRAKKQVLDWGGLRAQVRRWQAEARLGWSDDDVEQVARHLNERFYRLPPTARVAVQAAAVRGR